MSLNRLEITHVRNLNDIKLNCATRYNIVYGENGSGKTSILEAVHLLALGRSFRSHLKTRFINHQADSLLIFAQIYTSDNALLSAGIQKFANGQTQLRLNQQHIDSIAELAKLLPIQLLTPDSYELLTAASKVRRQFMDWGVFHVEPQFYNIWLKTERILKQRNTALKHQATREEIVSWDSEFSSLASQLDKMRIDYLNQLLPIIHEFSSLFPDFPTITIDYSSGWKNTASLSEQLTQTLPRDLLYGYTQIGPQRANLHIKAENKPAQDFLSRGQQKILVFILRLAQAELLKRQQNKTCVYLIDDLASELDTQCCRRIIGLIKQLSGQFFITGVDLHGLTALINEPASSLFHVKQGTIVPAQ